MSAKQPQSFLEDEEEEEEPQSFLEDEEDEEDEEEEDKKCPPNLHVSRSNPNEGHKKGGATLFYDKEGEDTKCPPQQVSWTKEIEDRADHHKPRNHHKHRRKHRYQEEEEDYYDVEEDKKYPPNPRVSRSNPNKGHKTGATLFYEEKDEDTKCPPQQHPWPTENEERADHHKPRKHHKHRDKHDKHAHKHHKHEHMNQPSMESSNHKKAQREFAQNDEETFEMEEGVFGAEWEKFNEATDGHVPSSDPSERGVSSEARNAVQGSSGGRHAAPSLRGTGASPGAEAVDSRAHPPNNAQRRTHALPPTRPGAQRVPGPDNEGLDDNDDDDDDDDDDEQTTVVSHEESIIAFVPNAERVNPDEDRQAAINDFIATAPVADVVPDVSQEVSLETKGRRQKLCFFGRWRGSSSTPQYKAFNWTVTNSSDLAALSNEQIIQQIIQRYALATFFFSTNGKSWENNTGWLSEEEECTWRGVECTPSGAFTGLDFYDEVTYLGNNLDGPLPPEIGLLSKLARLDLQNNTLRGTIPSEIGMLSDMQELGLFANALEGTIPSELWQLTKLALLNLAGNKLSGTIPSEIWMLFNLEFLWLVSNALKGMVPSEVGLLTKLFGLDLSDNKLTGTIPSEMKGLVNLNYLSLYGNNFTGNYTCPDSIGSCWISCDYYSDEYSDACRSF